MAIPDQPRIPAATETTSLRPILSSFRPHVAAAGTGLALDAQTVLWRDRESARRVLRMVREAYWAFLRDIFSFNRVIGTVSPSTSLPSVARGDTPQVIEEVQEQGHVSLRDLLALRGWRYGNPRSIPMESVVPVIREDSKWDPFCLPLTRLVRMKRALLDTIRGDHE
jgi:hypothetical protein